MAWKYLWQRPLVTWLTLISVALGSALISTVLTLRRETEQTFLKESSTFDLVVGAKGSPLQLTLSTIYHLDVPTGNIPYPRYQALLKDLRIRSAVPIGLGDNYQGFRIVGTLPEFFELERRVSSYDEHGEKKKGFEKLFAFAEGRVFAKDFEAVIGSQAAVESGLKIGDTFVGSHGLIAVPGSEDHGAFPYTVVGIMKASGTANDRALFSTMGSVWKVHDKEAAAHREDVPEDLSEREVTAVLVQLKAVGLRMWIQDEVQKQTESMAAIPINQMQRMYQQFLSPMQKTLMAMAYVVVAVAALTILATLYQSAERRRRDVAVMRALGARPYEVFFLVMIEAFLLTALGIGCGWLLGHGGIYLAAETFQKSFGLALNAWSTDALEMRSLGIVLAAGLLAGFVPALLNYFRSPVQDLSRT